MIPNRLEDGNIVEYSSRHDHGRFKISGVQRKKGLAKRLVAPWGTVTYFYDVPLSDLKFIATDYQDWIANGTK